MCGEHQEEYVGSMWEHRGVWGSMKKSVWREGKTVEICQRDEAACEKEKSKPSDDTEVSKWRERVA